MVRRCLGLVLLGLFFLVVACTEEEIPGSFYVVYKKGVELGWVMTDNGLVKEVSQSLERFCGKLVFELGTWSEKKGYDIKRVNVDLDFRW